MSCNLTVVDLIEIGVNYNLFSHKLAKYQTLIVNSLHKFRFIVNKSHFFLIVDINFSLIPKLEVCVYHSLSHLLINLPHVFGYIGYRPITVAIFSKIKF